MFLFYLCTNTEWFQGDYEVKNVQALTNWVWLWRCASLMGKACGEIWTIREQNVAKNCEMSAKITRKMRKVCHTILCHCEYKALDQFVYAISLEEFTRFVCKFQNMYCKFTAQGVSVRTRSWVCLPMPMPMLCLYGPRLLKCVVILLMTKPLRCSLPHLRWCALSLVFSRNEVFARGIICYSTRKVQIGRNTPLPPAYCLTNQKC